MRVALSQLSVSIILGGFIAVFIKAMVEYGQIHIGVVWLCAAAVLFLLGAELLKRPKLLLLIVLLGLALLFTLSGGR